jgi:hypothetical protein
VRPYIQGLYNWLNTPGQNRADPPQPANNPPRYQIPGDYSIVYRERPVGGLAAAFQDNTALQADLWFCMSLSVARAADTVAKAQNQPLTTPIVAIVSAAQAEHFGRNVCGVSAGRDRLETQCYNEFKTRIPAVQNFFALHRQNYDPSERARQGIPPSVTLVSVLDSDTTQQFHNKITTQIVNVNLPNKGVLVLPADRFFGGRCVDRSVDGSDSDLLVDPRLPRQRVRRIWIPTNRLRSFPGRACGQHLEESGGWRCRSDTPSKMGANGYGLSQRQALIYPPRRTRPHTTLGARGDLRKSDGYVFRLQ